VTAPQATLSTFVHATGSLGGMLGMSAAAALTLCLHLALMASAASDENPALASDAGDVAAHRSLLRQEEEGPWSHQRGDKLLQPRPLSLVAFRSSDFASGSAALFRDGSEPAAKLSICHEEVVADTCRIIRRNDMKTEPVGSVTLRQLDNALGACEGLVIVGPVLKLLDLEGELQAGKGGSGREDMVIDCMDLCLTVQEYFEAQEGYKLPPYSDDTCYSTGGAGLRCGLSVTPDILSTKMKGSNYSGKPGDQKSTAAHSSHREAIRSGAEFNKCPFQQQLAVLRVAQLFRFYPRRYENDFIDPSPPMPAPRQKHVFEALAKVEVWLSLTLRAMINHEEVAERERYFGGKKGRHSKSTVRQMVWNVLAYAMRELMRGIHVGMGRHCESTVLGYVWAEPEETGDLIRPNTGGCSPSDGECGLGLDHRYHVYICEAAFHCGEAEFVSLFLHEVVHHAGPVDITYNLRKMVRLHQREQLFNADNYQQFFLAVVTEEELDQSRWKKFWGKVASNFKKRREKRKARREERKDKRDARKEKRKGRRGQNKKRGPSKTRSPSNKQNPNNKKGQKNMWTRNNKQKQKRQNQKGKKRGKNQKGKQGML